MCVKKSRLVRVAYNPLLAGLAERVYCLIAFQQWLYDDPPFFLHQKKRYPIEAELL